MNKSWLVALIPGALALGVGIFILALFLVKLVWAWTIPDLFPGAVAQGLISKDISWYTALKLAIFVAVVTSMAHGSRGNHRS